MPVQGFDCKVVGNALKLNIKCQMRWDHEKEEEKVGARCIARWHRERLVSDITIFDSELDRNTRMFPSIRSIGVSDFSAVTARSHESDA